MAHVTKNTQLHKTQETEHEKLAVV